MLTRYSLIHVPPDRLDGVLRELRRLLAPGGVLVVGFFEGPVPEPFAHAVTTAHRWPADEFARRLTAAGFTERERLRRGRRGERRPHAALAAVTRVGAGTSA